MHEISPLFPFVGVFLDPDPLTIESRSSPEADPDPNKRKIGNPEADPDPNNRAIV